MSLVHRGLNGGIIASVTYITHQCMSAHENFLFIVT